MSAGGEMEMRVPIPPQAHLSESKGTIHEGHQKISLLPGENVLSVFCIDPIAVGGRGI
jgi:hypothetical protein